MRIIWDNEIDKHELICTLENPAYPIENVQDYQLIKKWRSPAFNNLIDRPDCESTTPPMIFDETVPDISNAIFARDAYKHTGTYSYRITKTIASGTYAFVTLYDNSSTDDIHGLVAGHTYTFSIWVFVSTAGGLELNEAKTLFGQYFDGGWHYDNSTLPMIKDIWQKLTVTVTLNTNTTGVMLRPFSSSTTDINEYFYVDDIELYDVPQIKIDAGAEEKITASCAGILGHNLTAGGTFKIQAHDDDISWNDPDLNETLTHADIMLKYFTEASYRYWMFTFNDIANPDGYIEIGRLTLSTHLQIDIHSREISIVYEDTSRIDDSPSGQSFGDEGIIRRLYYFIFPYWENDKRKEVVLMIKGVKKVKPIVLVPDENNIDKMDIVYCRLNDDMSINHIIDFSWNGVMAFKEVF